MRRFVTMLALAGGVALAAGGMASSAAAQSFSFGFGTPYYCDDYYNAYSCPDDYGYYDYGVPYYGWGGRHFSGHFTGHGGHFGGHFSSHGGHMGGHGHH